LYTDKDIPVILGLDDVYESIAIVLTIAIDSTSASEIAIIQSEKSQSTIPNLFMSGGKYNFRIYYSSAGRISI